jgi:stress-induced-phosphoprotein 1
LPPTAPDPPLRYRRNEVYFSNRAAALTSLKRYHEAAADARRVVQLKPRWAKGHSRLGAALLGAEQFAEALEAYEDALELEPEDRALQAALHQALTLQARQEADGKHKFKRKHEGGGGGGRAGQKAAQKPQGAPPPVQAAVKNKALLSFGEDEGGEDF